MLFLFILALAPLQAAVPSSERLLDLKVGTNLRFTETLRIPSILVSRGTGANEIDADYMRNNPDEAITVRVGVSFGRIGRVAKFNETNSSKGLCKFTYWAPFKYLKVASDGKIFTRDIQIDNLNLVISEKPTLDRYGAIEVDASNAGQVDGEVPFISTLECHGPMIQRNPELYRSRAMTIDDLSTLFGLKIVAE